MLWIFLITIVLLALYISDLRAKLRRIDEQLDELHKIPTEDVAGWLDLLHCQYEVVCCNIELRETGLSQAEKAAIERRRKVLSEEFHERDGKRSRPAYTRPVAELPEVLKRVRDDCEERRSSWKAALVGKGARH